MQLRPAYPVDAVTGGCFITGRYEIDDGEQIIDLDIDLDALPAWGRLCISAKAVQLLNNQLGWEWDPKVQTRVAEQRQTIRELRAENASLRESLDIVREAMQRTVTVP